MPQTEQITLVQFAKELGVPIERIQPLVDREYIRVMHLGPDPDSTIVARPLPGGMDWLRTMFMPLQKRPYLPLPDAAAIMGITAREARFICVTDNIQLYDDPVFGELISTSGYINLKRGLIAKDDALRFDRQTMMIILARMKRAQKAFQALPNRYPYNERIEAEIRRIAKLPEPQRTLRATELWATFHDADVVTECLKTDDKVSLELHHLRRKMNSLEEKMMNKLPWDEIQARFVRTKRQGFKAGQRNAAARRAAASAASQSDQQPDDMSNGSESLP